MVVVLGVVQVDEWIDLVKEQIPCMDHVCFNKMHDGIVDSMCVGKWDQFQRMAIQVKGCPVIEGEMG